MTSAVIAESSGARTAADVLAAARALLLEQGFDALSMEQVRRRAGVSNGSLYHHYPTKGHLARAVYGQVLEDYQTCVADALHAAPTALTGIQGLVAAHIDWVLRSPPRARLLSDLRAYTLVQGEEPVWSAANRHAFALLQQWIASHVAQGSLRPMPFEVWMAVVIGPVMQMTERWCRQADPVVPDELRRHLSRAAWMAVAAIPVEPEDEP
jgi:AcrR family transcriptional regulator